MYSRIIPSSRSLATLLALSVIFSACGPGDEPCVSPICEPGPAAPPPFVTAFSPYCDQEPMPPACLDVDPEPDPDPTPTVFLRGRVENVSPSAYACFIEYAHPGASFTRVLDSVVQPGTTAAVSPIASSATSFNVTIRGGCFAADGAVHGVAERAFLVNTDVTCTFVANQYTVYMYCDYTS